MLLALLESKRQRRAQRHEFEIPSFVEFFEKTVPFAIEGWQAKLCDRLEQLRFQKGQRIRIHKPPQHGGSIVLSQRLPPYLIGCNPEIAIRLVTYNETHSERFGRVIRNIMQSEEYRKIFPSPDAAIPQNVSASEWSTAKRAAIGDARASFKGLGLQTGIVGTGGNLWIIDDPYKSREEAFSDTINDKIWWTWKEDIAVRLAPDDNVIIMYHSYNEKDFSSRLKAEGGWEEIRIPAICDAPDDFCGRQIGEALSPRYPIEYLLRVRDGYFDENGDEILGIGEATFESLYQGNPKPRDGILFRSEWFKTISEYERSKEDIFVRYWDLGGSDSADSDRSAGALAHRDKIGRVTYHDCEAFRMTPHKRNERIIEVAKQDCDKYCGGDRSRYFIGIEEAPGLGAEPTNTIVRALIGWQVYKDKVSRDKEARAKPLATFMEAGNVEFMIGVRATAAAQIPKWFKELQEEMLAFPAGKHDDRVDSVSGAFNMISKIKIS